MNVIYWVPNNAHTTRNSNLIISYFLPSSSGLKSLIRLNTTNFSSVQMMAPIGCQYQRSMQRRIPWAKSKQPSSDPLSKHVSRIKFQKPLWVQVQQSNCKMLKQPSTQAVAVKKRQPFSTAMVGSRCIYVNQLHKTLKSAISTAKIVQRDTLMHRTVWRLRIHWWLMRYLKVIQSYHKTWWRVKRHQLLKNVSTCASN